MAKASEFFDTRTCEKCHRPVFMGIGMDSDIGAYLFQDNKAEACDIDGCETWELICKD